MEKGLVSILTPCFNTGLYIHRLLDSVYSQSYPSIEMFIIDDGSTDNSKEVIMKYIPKFQDKGYKLEYVWQRNSGQSVAIENGLNLINGEFLVWPDSDDYYESEDAIAKMVFALENASLDFAMVRTQEQIVEDNTFSVIGHFGLNVKKEEDVSLFYDCLFQKNGYYFCPGAYMVRVGALRETTGMSIFTAKDAGQNWQLMLPILYKYRCLSIPEVLYSVVERIASHSRGQYKGYESSLQKYAVYEQTILETLNRIDGMPYSECQDLKKAINSKYKAIRLSLHFSNGKIRRFREEYRRGGQLRGKDLIRNLCLFIYSYTPFVYSSFLRRVAISVTCRLL